MAGYPHPQGDTLYVSPTLTKIMQYSQAAPSFAFHLFNQVAQPLAGKECFIYFRFFSHKFVSASLREPSGFFFPWFLTGIPLILSIWLFFE